MSWPLLFILLAGLVLAVTLTARLLLLRHVLGPIRVDRNPGVIVGGEAVAAGSRA